MSPRSERLRGHWLLLSVWLLAVVVALLAHGVNHRLLAAPPDGAVARSAPPVPFATGLGPVVQVEDGQVRSTRPRPGTVALTFDDGPDPAWTPLVLDVLQEHGVHATFFVVGSSVSEQPELLRRIVDEGHEVGLHTWTHADLAAVPSWRRHLELTSTQLAIAGSAGRVSALVRPPYVSTVDELDAGTWEALRDAGGQGAVTVLTTLDSEDWRRPGVEEIVRRSTPATTDGDVLLLHDGGGDRSQTVAALRELLPALQARGLVVGSVGETVGLSAADNAATRLQSWQGRGLLFAVRTSDVVVSMLEVLLVVCGLLSLARAALLVVGGRRHARQQRRRRRGPRVHEPVSVVVPAHDERAGIEAAVLSIVASNHPVEVVVVDDGSTDGTADAVEALGLPGVTVVRQANAGKPAALNAGLAVARHELVVMVDGDTVLEPDAVGRLVQRFADPRVGAVSGNAKVANRGGLLGRWQHIEYVVGFNLDRRFYDLAECMPTVPGAIGGFRRAALRDVGGVSGRTLAEDTDLTMSLQRAGWRAVYEPRAVAWTEVPGTLRALWRQRYRWCYGTLQSAWHHRRAFLERGSSGRLGRRGLSYLLLFQVLLPLVAPVVDLVALVGFLALDPWRTSLVWLGFLALQLGLAAYAFRLDGEPLRPLLTLPLQQVVHRQLMYLVVIQSVVTALVGSRLRWHRIERYGSLRAPVPETRGRADESATRRSTGVAPAPISSST